MKTGGTGAATPQTVPAQPEPENAVLSDEDAARLLEPEPEAIPEPEAEPDPETEPVDEKAEAQDPEADDGQEPGTTDDEGDDGEAEFKKELSPEMQEAFNKRVGRYCRQTREAQEALETEQERRAEMETELERMRGELSEMEQAQLTQAGGVHPTLTLQSERDLDKREAYLAQVEAACLQNWDGYEPDGEGKAYTPAEVRARYADVRQELDRILPKARKQLAQRQAAEAEALGAYPDLRDRKSEQYLAAQQILREVPTLKLHPRGLMLAGDILAGRAARNAKAAATPKPKAKPAPRVPTAATPSSRGPADAGTPARKDANTTFAEGGFTDEAAAAALA